MRFTCSNSKTLILILRTSSLPKVSVPGAVEAWCALHEQYGRLELRELLQPAIEAAREGFFVTQVIAAEWAEALETFEQAASAAEITSGGRYPGAFAGFEQVYLRGQRLGSTGARAPREGELFTNAALARALQLIADEGCGSFYNGIIAEELAAYLNQTGSALTAEDLAVHRGEWIEAPASVTYRERYTVYELPPNVQGIAALSMLNMLELVNVSALGHNSADLLHLSVEIKKLAFADRAKYYADRAFADVPVGGLLSKEYARRRFELIDPQKAAMEVDAGDPAQQAVTPDGAGTAYTAAADKDGLMVSFIQSNYKGFGSALAAPSLGFALQNRGALFDVDDPAHANAYAPGKRPFHTIMPGMALKDGKPWYCFGVMGGNFQPQGQVQVLSNLIDHGMGVQEAGDAARWSHGGSTQPTSVREAMRDGGTVSLERGVCEAAVAELRRRGHRVERGANTGGYQGILVDTDSGAYLAASEVRKDGQAGALL